MLLARLLRMMTRRVVTVPSVVLKAARDLVRLGMKLARLTDRFGGLVRLPL